MKIHIEPGAIELEGSEDESLLNILISNQIAISHSCEGMGTCGTCKIYVIDYPKPLPARNEVEDEMALERKYTDCERLACQFYCTGDLKIKV